MNRTLPKRDSTKLVYFITIIGAIICAIYTDSILTIILAVFLQIIIHEAGHLVFGLLSGYKFYSFRFLMFMIYKNKDSKIKFKLFSLIGTSGQCLMLPPETKTEDTPFLLYNMGGVMLNLITMPIFTAAYFAVSDIFLRTLFFCLIVMALTVALTNGIPFYTSYIANDGMNAMNIYKSSRAMHAFRLILTLHAEIENGLKYQDILDERLAVEDEDFYNAISANIPFLAAYVAFMKKDFEKARALAERLVSFESHAIELHKMLATMLILYCEAVGESKKSILMLYERKDVVKFMRKAHVGDVIRAKYAVEKLVSGDMVKAEKAKKLFERVSKRTKDKEQVEIERAFYDYVDQIYIWRLENLESTDEKI